MISESLQAKPAKCYLVHTTRPLTGIRGVNMSCATGLESFAAASEQAASDRRARRHATAQATRVGPACPQCGRVCASDFGLRSHLRVHQRPQ